MESKTQLAKRENILLSAQPRQEGSAENLRPHLCNINIIIYYNDKTGVLKICSLISAIGRGGRAGR